MGATVTCNKRAAAFRGADSEITYILYEETYEKNCYPHCPHWSVVFIGGLKSTVARVFFMGAECEGGCLQNPRGYTSPEAYIAGWMKELASPLWLPDQPVRLRASTIDGIERVQAFLMSNGHSNASLALSKDGTASLSLHQDSGLICSLVTEKLVSPWKLFEDLDIPPYTERRPELGYHPNVKSVAARVRPKLIKAGQEEYLMEDRDGSWRCAGWAYSIIKEYVQSAWEEELETPGSFRSGMRAYRDALRNAPALPVGTRVLVQNIETMSEYTRFIWNPLFQKYRPVATEQGYELDTTPKAVELLGRFEPEHVKWLLPQHEGTYIQAALF